jgi:PAS domain S-box-containing protein
MSSNSSKEIIDSGKGKRLNNTRMSKRQTEEFCLSLVKSTSDSMYLVDKNCRYLFINSQHLSRMGMPSADIIGRSYEEFHSPEQTEVFVEKVNQVFKTGKSVQQEHHSRRDGRYFLRTFSPIKEVGLSEQIIRVAVVSKDITELKKADEALRTEMRFINNLIQASPAFFVAIGADGKIIMMNDLFLNALGYSHEEVVGKDYLSTIVPERDWDSLSTIFEKLVISHEPSLNENHVLSRDGRELLVEWHGRPVFDDKENFLYFFGVGIDITERKLAEEALRKSEERYRTILEKIEDGYYEMNLAGSFTFFNDSFQRIMGYSREELMGINYKKYVTDEENIRKIFQAYNRVYMTGEPLTQFEWDIIRKDGVRGSLEVSASLIKDSSGNPQGFRGIVTDITERKRAEELLRESEKRYRELTDFLPISIFEIDAAGSIVSLNQNTLEVFRYNKEDYKEGMNALQFFPPEEWQKVRENMGKLIQGKSGSGREYTFLRKDGSTFIGLAYSSPNIRQDKTVGIRGAIIDITERKRADNELRKAYGQLRAADEQMRAQYNSLVESERSLRESEEKYRNILENIGEAYFEIDLKGNMTFCNDSTCSISGYAQSELMNMNYRQYTSPETEKKLRTIFKNIYKTGEKGSLYDFEVIRKDKRTRNMELSLNLMRNSEGEAIGFRCIARDFTERKRAEGERRRLEERLQRAEKMEALGTLAGGVAHDLNNVLGVLVGYSELLLQNVPQDSPFQRHAIQIFKGGQRAAAIIQDLLTLTRRGVVISETLNLNRVISDFLQMPEFEAIRSHHPGVTFKTSLDEELLNVKGSPTHLGKTVMNLLSNAAEAISGLGEVLITTENCYVDRPIHGYENTQEGEYAVLTVSDTGSGISSSDIGRIFEPFYTKKVMGRSGTGLGLAVVWGTVKDHSGYIDVQSTEGKGTVFTLYFPVTREDLTKVEQVVPQRTYLGRGEHILVVDDVEGQRLLASAMLEGLGYKVSSVASGEGAIEFVKNKPVDLLILDMIMDPGMDGLDTYRSIIDIRPQQKAIIVSGFSETDRVYATQSLGAGAYIRKPYVIEKLGLAVKKELDRK